VKKVGMWVDVSVHAGAPAAIAGAGEVASASSTAATLDSINEVKVASKTVAGALCPFLFTETKPLHPPGRLRELKSRGGRLRELKSRGGRLRELKSRGGRPRDLKS
jgi:hypothetical protein